MPGETSRGAVLERLQAHVGEWVTATVGAREVVCRITIALELSRTRSGTSDRCPR